MRDRVDGLTRRGFGAGLAGVAAAATLGHATAARALDVGEAQEFVSRVAQRIVALLSSDGPIAAKREAFRSIMVENAAMDDIARVALGVPWRKLDDAGRARYTRAFVDYLTSSYLRRFDEYSGQMLSVTSARDAGAKGVFVRSAVAAATAGSEPIDVEWRVADRGGKPVILDIYIEGVSLLVTQQTEFSGMLDRNGGDVGKLIEFLEANAV